MSKYYISEIFDGALYIHKGSGRCFCVFENLKTNNSLKTNKEVLNLYKSVEIGRFSSYRDALALKLELEEGIVDSE